MGKKEAISDGVEFYYDKNRGARGHVGVTVYKVKCEVCGEIMEVINYGRNLTYICVKCKYKADRHKKEVEKAWFDVIEEKGERQFNKALDRIEKQVKNFDAYSKAVAGARKAQDKYGSVPEAMVAVELLKLGYPFVPQMKVGRYRADFYIPKLKAIIEVDGAIYHQNDSGAREFALQRAIGFENKIIHVPAEKISEDITKLKVIIDKMIKEP